MEKVAQQEMILFPMLPEMRLRLLQAKTTPYGRYPETIRVHAGKMTGVNNSNLPEETYEGQCLYTPDPRNH